MIKNLVVSTTFAVLSGTMGVDSAEAGWPFSSKKKFPDEINRDVVRELDKEHAQELLNHLLATLEDLKLQLDTGEKVVSEKDRIFTVVNVARFFSAGVATLSFSKMINAINTHVQFVNEMKSTKRNEIIEGILKQYFKEEQTTPTLGDRKAFRGWLETGNPLFLEQNVDQQAAHEAITHLVENYSKEEAQIVVNREAHMLLDIATKWGSLAFGTASLFALFYHLHQKEDRVRLSGEEIVKIKEMISKLEKEIKLVQSELRYIR